MTLYTAVLLHQVYRPVRQLEQMWMRAIAIGQDRKAEFAIAIAEQESRITWNAAAVCDVTVTLAHLRPPGQAEPGGFVAPNVFDRSLELFVLPHEHLIQSRLADQPVRFEYSAIEICD